MVSTWMGDRLGTPCAVDINFEFFHVYSFKHVDKENTLYKILFFNDTRL